MDAPAKQQIVERVKQAENILVTVSRNPTVDQLAACIGLTLLLNKMGKHATAVFSGKVPSTIQFLQPEKTLEPTTDSLRDFIISLDKDKADKLRYKVEDQVVRIFITPYRTSISEKDLVFTQGDFNVEVVIALGIKDRSQIDAAIAAHGRILHDATVVSLNHGQGIAAELGQINWQDPTASSLCEMIVSISEAFGSGLIDNQMATAFLTGIVAETERFSNTKTSPKVMTISAQMMASGANQQLIATKLQPPPPPPPPPPPRPKKEAPKPKPAEPPPKPNAELEAKLLNKNEGSLNVQHETDRAAAKEVNISPNEIRIDEEGNIETVKDEAEAKAKSQKPVEPQKPAEPEPPKIEKSQPLIEETQPFSPEPPPPVATSAEPTPPALPPSEPLKVPETPSTGAGAATPRPTLPTPPVTDAYKPHQLVDPLNRQPSIGGPFSADTGPQFWADPYNSVPFDPLNNPSQTAGTLGATPPQQAPSGQLDIDKIRNNVENIYGNSTPNNLPPQQNSGAGFLEPGLHTPPPANNAPASNATPSLQLPSNGAPQSPPPFPPPPTFPPPPPS